MGMTVDEAYKLGNRHGLDRSGMLAYRATWPTEADFEHPTPAVRAYLRGITDGEETADRYVPSWAQPEYEQRSDAAPNL